MSDILSYAAGRAAGRAEGEALAVALEELAGIVQGVLDGETKLDSFTLQPARAALARWRGR